MNWRRSGRHGGLCGGIAVLALSVLVAPQVGAQSLTEALATAYTNNPELGAERARLRATDEGVPQALAGMRPSATATTDYGYQTSHSLSGGIGSAGSATRVNTEPYGYEVAVRQTLFDGFQTINRTAQAEANIQAGRGILSNTEQNVLLSAATAFLDVRRDLAIVGLRQNNIDVLREELNSTQARFDVGELTRTDVAQSEARLSGSISAVSAARADLAASKATYEQIVGRAPGTLAPPPNMISKLPRTVTAAHAIAQEGHPAILSALHSVTASDHNVDAIQGEFMPRLSVEGSFRERYGATAPGSYNSAASVIGRLTIPLYQSGSVSSRVRQAKETGTQRRLEVETIRAQVRAAVTASWDGLVAARAQIVAGQQSVRAAGVALDGVRQEAQVGQRTTLDVLNAQQELLDARVQLAIIERNEQVATFNLIAAIGRLNAGNLNLAVANYDPSIHYDSVRGQWWGVDADMFEGDLLGGGLFD